jgi:hypothetical protein
LLQGASITGGPATTLEAISKPQMAFEGKAKADAQSRHGGMSILKRL